MHHAFRYPLPVEMGQLFDQVNILQEDGPVLPCSEGVLVIGNRNPLVRRKGFFAMLDQR